MPQYVRCFLSRTEDAENAEDYYLSRTEGAEDAEAFY
jgi:hypothetical protein